MGPQWGIDPATHHTISGHFVLELQLTPTIQFGDSWEFLSFLYLKIGQNLRSFFNHLYIFLLPHPHPPIREFILEYKINLKS